MQPADATRHLIPRVEEVVQAGQRGAKDAAERLCLDVLERAPYRSGTLPVLYSLRKDQGNLSAAGAPHRRLVHFDPNNSKATNELALLLLGLGATLVEQTLSAHPLISAGDELPLINDITNIMPRMLGSPLAYPEALIEVVVCG